MKSNLRKHNDGLKKVSGAVDGIQGWFLGVYLYLKLTF